MVRPALLQPCATAHQTGDLGFAIDNLQLTIFFSRLTITPLPLNPLKGDLKFTI